MPVFDIRIREPAGAMGSRGTSGARHQSEAITSPPAVRTTRTAIAMSAGGQAVRKSHRPLLGEDTHASSADFTSPAKIDRQEPWPAARDPDEADGCPWVKARRWLDNPDV